MAKLSKILIFPVKSLDPIALDEVEISEGGALKGDREFAMFDKSGKYINAKRYPKIHLIRARYEQGYFILKMRLRVSRPKAHLR